MNISSLFISDIEKIVKSTENKTETIKKEDNLIQLAREKAEKLLAS